MAFYEYWPSDDGRGYYLRFDYDQDLVLAIKQVPYISRRWDPEEKVWYIDRHWFRDACKFLDHAIKRNTGRDGHHGRETKQAQKEQEREQKWSEGAEWEDWKQDPFGGRRQYSSSNFQTPRTDDITAAFRALHLQTDAPLPVVEAVYRTLARMHHPDVGGDHRRMVEINLAYEKATKFAKKE